MRVRHVSSLLFLQKFPVTHQWRKWSLRTLAATAFGYAFPKTIGRFRTALYSRFPTCTHEDSPFHPLSLRPQRLHHRIFRGWLSFLCQGPGSRPTSFTDVRVSGAVGRLSSDQKARQPSSLSRILLINWPYIFSSYIYFLGTSICKGLKNRISLQSYVIVLFSSPGAVYRYIVSL